MSYYSNTNDLRYTYDLGYFIRPSDRSDSNKRHVEDGKQTSGVHISTSTRRVNLNDEYLRKREILEKIMKRELEIQDLKKELSK